MRQYLIGVAAAMAVATVSAPAMASCGGCAPAVSYSSCASPCGGGWGYGGGYGYATVAAPVQYYSVQPQYYYVNQGPTYTGPGMYAPVATYQQRSVGGWSGYGVGYHGYNGGPYANPSHHHYHGMPAVSTPTVYSYRRAYRPSMRYGYSQRYSYAPRTYSAPRYDYAPRVYRAPRMYAPRPAMRYGYRHMAPRYSVAPHQYHPRQRVLRRYN